MWLRAKLYLLTWQITMYKVMIDNVHRQSMFKYVYYLLMFSSELSLWDPHVVALLN